MRKIYNSFSNYFCRPLSNWISSTWSPSNLRVQLRRGSCHTSKLSDPRGSIIHAFKQASWKWLPKFPNNHAIIDGIKSLRIVPISVTAVDYFVPLRTTKRKADMWICVTPHAHRTTRHARCSTEAHQCKHVFFTRWFTFIEFLLTMAAAQVTHDVTLRHLTGRRAAADWLTEYELSSTCSVCQWTFTSKKYSKFNSTCRAF